MQDDEGRSAEYKINYSVYCNIFSNDFNLSFRTPRGDTCAVCDAHQADEHEDNAMHAQLLLKSDKEHAKCIQDTIFITMDMQQAMVLPKLTTSKAFYLRQLSFFNFGIHSVSREGIIPYMFTWTENIGKKGSVDVVSCLLQFVDCLHAPKKHLFHLVRFMWWPK